MAAAQAGSWGPLGHVVGGTGACKSRIEVQRERWERWRVWDSKSDRVVGFPLQSKTESIRPPRTVCDCLFSFVTTSNNLKRRMEGEGNGEIS